MKTVWICQEDNMEINYDIKLNKVFDKSEINKEINRVLKKIIKNIEKIMFVKKEQGKISSGMTLQEFVDNNAGLFLKDILQGFLDKGIISRYSYIRMVNDNQYKKELSLLAKIKDEHQGRFENADMQYILKQTGNLDSTTATRIFND